MRKLCPLVDTERYRRAAVWYDACVPDSPRLLIEVLRWAESKGAELRNYTEAENLLVRSGSVAGLLCRDVGTGETLEVRARVVVVATGSGVPRMLERFGLKPTARWQSSLAWNLLIDRPPPSDHALAVTVPSDGTTRFLHPFHGRCLVGTWHELTSTTQPTPDQVGASLAEVNAALPGFGAEQSDILRVMAGTLPAEPGDAMKLTVRPDVIDHGRVNGVQGLFSVTGIKFTTAQTVAHKLMNRIRPFSGQIWSERPTPRSTWRTMPCELEAPWTRRRLQRLIDQEWVVRPEDLAERRTNLWQHGGAGRRIARQLVRNQSRRMNEYRGNGTDDG
jgi:glycerol-3-phosphate dehydrogenase